MRNSLEALRPTPIGWSSDAKREQRMCQPIQGKKPSASIRLLDAIQTTPLALSGGMAGGSKCSM